MKKIIILFIVVGLLFSTAPMITGENAVDKSNEKIKVIIGFNGKPDTALINTFGGETKKEISGINAVTATIPETAINALQNNPKVRYIEEDKYVQLVSEQPMPWGVDRIDAEKVWSSNTGSDIYIAIVDTGIDYDHPDLDDNYAFGESFVDYTIDPMDDNGHGTHCAGIVAAENNDFGVVGVAPGAKLIAAKVLNSNGGAYLSWIADGITWAANNGADVISLSIGYDQHVQSWQAACDYAYAKGCVVVAAVGNAGHPRKTDRDNVDYPARYDSVIAVAATTSSDTRASFSSTGPDVELAAPGNYIYSTIWDNTYAYMSGTSMSCPHVAGVAALVINSGININTEVRQQMIDTAEDLGTSGHDWLFGYGIVDAEAAVGGGSPPDKHDVAITAIDAPSPVLQGDTANIDVTVANEGTYAETTTVTLTDTYDEIVIGSQDVSLSAGGSTTVTFTWDTTGEALGDHILEAAASVVPGETETGDNSMTTTVNVYEQGQQDYMYVSNISWSVKNAGPNKFLYYTVTVKGESGDLVSGATVYSTLTLTGGGSWDFSGITGENGQVKFRLGKAATGDYIAAVTDITHSIYVYNSLMDVDNPSYYTLT